MSDKYGVGQDSYCYPGSTVLRNKLDIRDDSTLNDAEQQLSAVAAATIEFSPPPYNLASLQKIHRTLFSDLYDWAGGASDSRHFETRHALLSAGLHGKGGRQDF